MAAEIGAAGWARWAWRQLTSMRVALLLLLALAVAAVPGSIFPQWPQDPIAVNEYLIENPTTGPWLERLGFFDVYASPWFSAIYLLLFTSLVGCIVPRIAQHWRALRTPPPRTPRRLERFVGHTQLSTTTDVGTVLDAATHVLRGARRAWPTYRVERLEEPDGAASVSAERGYLRETGNLVFHTALVGVLVCLVVGDFAQYRGQAILVEGRGFANSQLAYDSFEAGRAFDPESLVPFRLTLDRFDSAFDPLTLAARDFTAEVTVDEPGHDARKGTIKVNHPLSAGGAKIYLMGNGYAPEVRVHDADGELAFAGPVPFLPDGDVYASQGVIKVPDVTSGPQVGLVGYLLPTAVEEPVGFWRSVHPLPLDPVLVLSVWTGDLGLDAGLPQNVYRLDEVGMTQLTETIDGAERPVTVVVRPGETVELPDGLGSLSFDALPRFVALDLRHDPTLTLILVFALSALAGLGVSLFAPRRRVWVRAKRGAAGTTVVEVAGLARGNDPGLPAEIERVLTAVRERTGAVVEKENS
ncbi:MAG: cytochrome c biogenesis protein ResB [Actinomycetota bacterium]|nr:cytochrome c biogenesis protein ResB [Actinomycetota bacterium]